MVKSDLADRVAKNDSEMQRVYNYLDELRKVDASMREYIDSEI